MSTALPVDLRASVFEAYGALRALTFVFPKLQPIADRLGEALGRPDIEEEEND